MPPLNSECSDKEENETDVPPLPSIDNGHEENDPDMSPLSLVDSAEEGETRNYMSVTYFGSKLDLGSHL